MKLTDAFVITTDEWTQDSVALQVDGHDVVHLCNYDAEASTATIRVFNLDPDSPVVWEGTIELRPSQEVGPCIYCRLMLTDDGITLIDTTGGDACGVPLDNGAEHAHCTGFLLDTGADPLICATCFCHAVDHKESA